MHVIVLEILKHVQIINHTIVCYPQQVNYALSIYIHAIYYRQILHPLKPLIDVYIDIMTIYVYCIIYEPLNMS